MNRIKQLPLLLANQIAAGEVIERPASVVKELLENALDAKASQLMLEIAFGGLSQIKLSDNGCGIAAEDLSLAIAAHATSKIESLHDLYRIESLGFRGEALASIAAVSRLTIQSRPAHQEHAMQLMTDNQRIDITPCARSYGTTVHVEDLFFNAPVRKKFLKSKQSEYQAIESVVKCFALSAPYIGLNLMHDDKVMLFLPPALDDTHVSQRIRKILGKGFIDQSIYLDVERAGMHLRGWVSSETYQRSQSDKQWVYLNGRMIKDKLIQHAIKQAYTTILHPGRYPTCVLYLNVPAEEVDVNVHPTKHEVRFQEPRLVHDFISSQLVQALQPSSISISNHPLQEVREVLPNYRFDTFPGHRDAFSEEFPNATAYPPHHFIAVNELFAIILSQDRSYLVHVERLIRHKLQMMLQQAQLPLASRALLVPVPYPMNKKAVLLLEQKLPNLLQLGLQLDFLSETSVVVRTIPHILPSLDLKRFLHLLTNNQQNPINLIELLLDSCVFNIHQLSTDEKIDLIRYFQDQLEKSPLPQGISVSLTIERCLDMMHG